MSNATAAQHAPPIRPLIELEPEQRPRERLLREGAHALDDHELLALVLGTGRGSREDALQLGARILDEIGGVDRLARAAVADLRSISGIGPVRAARIRAAFELCLRGGPVEPDALPLPPPEEPAPDPFEVHRARLRGQVPPGETVLFGYRPDALETAPITLEVGGALGPETRPGSILVRLLGEAPITETWWVVLVRPGGRATKAERAAAARLYEAADALGMTIERVAVVGARRAWHIERGE